MSEPIKITAPDKPAPIKLKVPAEPRADYVSEGNFSATLEPNGTVETKSRLFADLLISQYELTEIPAAVIVQAPPVETKNAADYPADFPKKEVFIELNMSFETARNLSREQLLKIKGIGEGTADAILAYQPAPIEPAAADKTTEGEQN